MTKFLKENFTSGQYVEYVSDGKFKFVARFKYVPGNRGSFITFLIKNFEAEEYFDRMKAGESPVAILESKGYITAHIKKWLKRDGYEISQASITKMLDDQQKAREAV
jgi:hypothetical protein